MLNLNFSPFPTLYTTRLRLRHLEPTDAEAWYQMRINDKVMQYIDRARPASVTDISNLIQLIEENQVSSRSITWAITTKTSDTMIGTIGYHKIYAEHYRAEIGYMLAPEFWQSGIMSECITSVIHFGFGHMHLHSIEANINPANNASRQLLLKHGFKKEAYFKENFYFNGQFLDSEIYSLIQHDL